MAIIGTIIVHLIMACAFIGALASVFDENSHLGNEFLNGINSIGPIFLPVAGIMASAPYLTAFVTNVLSPWYELIGADPSMAATTLIAIDMGGYQLAHDLAQNKESWMMASVTGYMSGASLVFSIPVALKMLNKEDHQYLAMGVMAGFLAIPVGVFVSCISIILSDPYIRSSVTTTGLADYQLHLPLSEALLNLVPLAFICLMIAFGLYKIPNLMISGFIRLGRLMESALKLVFVCCVIEYFTGVFSSIFGQWGFDPIIADEEDINRALEVAGYIGIMLCGAFPMVYLIKTHLSKILSVIGEKFHLSTAATTGILAASANVLALFAMVGQMKPEDKVKTIAYAVCCAFLLGDHLAFSANFQPSMILPIMLGKLSGGILAVIIATKFVIPHVLDGNRD